MDNNLFTSFLYFYSAVAQSMAALFTVSGVFAIFKIQSIDDQLKKHFEAYKEYVRRCYSHQISKLRLEKRNADKEIEELTSVMNEVDEWLNKDIMPNLLWHFREEKKIPPDQLQPALADYFNSIDIRLKKKNLLITSLNEPLELSALTFIIALLLIHSTDNSTLQYFIAGTFGILIGWTICSIIKYIRVSMDDPEDNLFNNRLLGNYEGRETTIKEIEARMHKEIENYKKSALLKNKNPSKLLNPPIFFVILTQIQLVLQRLTNVFRKLKRRKV